MELRTLRIAPIALLFTTVSFAETCPTHFTQEYDGRWVSYQAPGWRSAKATNYHTTLAASDFGGAIYAPKQKRLACVYRSSKGYWVAMISHVHKGIQIDRHALDEARHVAWRWDPNMRDFSCSRPYVTSTTECKFSINASHA